MNAPIDENHRPEAADDRASIIIPMLAAAVSGCIVGIFFRGDILSAVLLFAIAVAAGAVGWWARGIR